MVRARVQTVDPSFIQQKNKFTQGSLYEEAKLILQGAIALQTAYMYGDNGRPAGS